MELEKMINLIINTTAQDFPRDSEGHKYYAKLASLVLLQRSRQDACKLCHDKLYHQPMLTGYYNQFGNATITADYCGGCGRYLKRGYDPKKHTQP